MNKWIQSLTSCLTNLGFQGTKYVLVYRFTVNVLGSVIGFSLADKSVLCSSFFFSYPNSCKNTSGQETSFSVPACGGKMSWVLSNTKQIHCVPHTQTDLLSFTRSLISHSSICIRQYLGYLSPCLPLWYHLPVLAEGVNLNSCIYNSWSLPLAKDNWTNVEIGPSSAKQILSSQGRR